MHTKVNAIASDIPTAVGIKDDLIGRGQGIRAGGRVDPFRKQTVREARNTYRLDHNLGRYGTKLFCPFLKFFAQLDS